MTPPRHLFVDYYDADDQWFIFDESDAGSEFDGPFDSEVEANDALKVHEIHQRADNA